MKKIGKHRLIERITDNAMMEGSQSAIGRKMNRPLKGNDLPGRRIMNLKDEEREVLKTCKGKDFSWRGFK